MNGGLVDFHCHLDLFPDPEAAVCDADTSRIYTLTVTTTPKAWPRNLAMTRATRHVRAALGLHPQLVSERSSEIGLWEEYLPQARYVGEVGIDAGLRYYRTKDQQAEIFKHILKKCAEVGSKILTVHSARASRLVLDLIEANLPETRGTAVLHWFSGSHTEARRAAALGCYFSVNRAMTTTPRGRELVSSLPLDRLLTETDAPFTGQHGRQYLARDIAGVIEQLSEIRRLELSVVVSTIHENLHRLVKRFETSLP